MYEDFKNKSYWKTSHKIRTLWYILRRILGGAIEGESVFANLLERISFLENKISNLNNRLKRYIPGNKTTYYNYDTDFDIEEPEEENLPDLTINSIITQDKGHYILFEIQIKNIGEAGAGGNSLKFEISEEEDYTQNLAVPSLEVGSLTTLYYSFPYDETGNPKNYTAITTVDINNIIEESDESNNIDSKNFSAKDKHVPSSGYGYLFYHIHNPEGVEINSITDVGLVATLEYTRIPSGSPHGTVYGAHNEATHIQLSGGSMLELPIGTYQLIASFNGMTKTRNIIIQDENSITEMFIFNRTEVTDYITDNRSYSHDFEVDGENIEHSNFDYFFGDEPYGRYRTKYKGSGTHWHTYGEFSQNLDNNGISISINGTCDVTGVGYSGRLEIGAHNYGAGFVSYDLDVNIPAQIFDWWYCQHGNANNYITIKGQTGYASRIICKKDYSGYHLDTTGAKNLIVSFPITGGDSTYFYAQPNAEEESWNSSGTISDFHISSVPYDLDGNGVKG